MAGEEDDTRILINCAEILRCIQLSYVIAVKVDQEMANAK